MSDVQPRKAKNPGQQNRGQWHGTRTMGQFVSTVPRQHKPSVTESKPKGYLIPNSRRYPLAGIIGPTIYDEGRMLGCPVNILQFPAQGDDTEKLTVNEMLDRIDGLPGSPGWVVLSGENVTSFELEPLVTGFHKNRTRVAVSIEGRMWKEWLLSTEHLILTPVPPSQGGNANLDFLHRCIVKKSAGYGTLDLIVPIYEGKDIDYAKNLFRKYPPDGDKFRHFLSVRVPEGEEESLPCRYDKVLQTCLHGGNSFLSRVCIVVPIGELTRVSLTRGIKNNGTA